MSIFNTQIGGEIIVLRTTSDKTRLKLTVNRFIKAFESSLILKENIDKILNNELINKEKIKDKTKKAIKEYKIKKMEELDNYTFLKAANECFGEDKKKIKHIKMVK